MRLEETGLEDTRHDLVRDTVGQAVRLRVGARLRVRARVEDERHDLVRVRVKARVRVGVGVGARVLRRMARPLASRHARARLDRVRAKG